MENQALTINLAIPLPLFEKLVYLVNNAGAPLNMKVMDIAEVVVFLNSANLEITKQLEAQKVAQSQPQPEPTQDGTQGTETPIQPETAN